MTECFDPGVRDYLPDLVHGRLGDVDTATMLAHVDACEECAREVTLLREVRAAAPAAPRIDVRAIVAALPAARIPAFVPVPARRSYTLLRLVAAAAVVVSGALVLKGESGPPMPDLAESTRSAQASPLSLVSGVQDLTDEEIETLLTQLDDIEAIPASEPDQSLTSLDALETAR